MVEFVTEAMVLDKVDSGEQDSRVYLYTKDAGKLSCKVKSVRKITSKLASHLQPLNLVMARIVDKNGPQLVDTLALKQYPRNPELLRSFFLVKELAAESQPDLELWQFLETLPNRRDLLKFLGFDPLFARCEVCQNEKPAVFCPADFHFYCKNCSPPNTYEI